MAPKIDSNIKPTQETLKLEDTSAPPNIRKSHEGILRIDKTLRIAVSGDVFLTRLEREIIDTPDFQRLRGVRQLGSVYMVYPTALHTRFDHCLGTLSMAAKMVRAIRENTHSNKDERSIESIQEALTRLYALLHDLPHVPFGHTIEDELRIFERHDKNDARIERFLGRDSDIGGLIRQHLGDAAYKRFMAIYRWNGKDKLQEDDAFIYDIVSNTVCADLLDYLARDSYFCNLELHSDYRFLNFLYLRRDESGMRRVFVRLWKENKPQPRRDTLTDLARLLESRYVVAERAYFHHTKIICGAMLGRAIQEAYLSGELKEEHLYQHTDDTLLHSLRNSKNPLAAGLGNGLINRRLYKTLKKYTPEDFGGAQERDYDHSLLSSAISRLSDPKDRKTLEDQLAEEIGAHPGDIIIYAPPEGMNLKVAEMKVLWKGKPEYLKDIDDPVIKPMLGVILDAHKKLWAIHVITRPDLSPKQQELLLRACDILLLYCGKEQEAELRRYYESLIEYHLAESGIDIPSNMGKVAQLRSQAAEELLTTADDNRPWNQRVTDVVKHFFIDTKG
jgi:uncharacterized protein